MIIRRKSPRALALNEPLRHPDHKRPITRRELIAQGFMTGAATLAAPTLLGTLLSPRLARAALSGDINPGNLCQIYNGAGKIPFICFDLAGGANIAGSNVLVGQRNGQLDPLSTAGYSKLGLPGNMIPTSSTGAFINTEFGLAFHTDSAFLRGMQATTSATTRAMVNGAVIPARSENDTGNNPHNPMYGIARAGVPPIDGSNPGGGARGSLLTLIGSQNSDSGGNSMAPAALMEPTLRPTKVDRPTDATGLVDTGDLGTLFGNKADTLKVLESIDRISRDRIDTEVAPGSALNTQIECAYVKAADQVDKTSGPSALDPRVDAKVTAAFANVGGIASDNEFAKTASVMKLIVQGYAGAGTITMGGFDYHTGDRSTGEARDFRAGQCIGACLEYAAREGKPLMLYVFSDGSLSSNGMLDNSVGGGGKGQWTGDNQATASSFFLVLSPAGRPTLLNAGGVPPEQRQQLGYFRASGDVETTSNPGANGVNILVDMVLLNYMALHGEQNEFANRFPGSVLATTAQIDRWTAFNPIVSGPI